MRAECCVLSAVCRYLCHSTQHSALSTQHFKAANTISIRGAREHNLKNISLDIPRDEFVVVTGLSGSGKSSLAFDLIFAEGQRRFLDSMSVYARTFVEQNDEVTQNDEAKRFVRRLPRQTRSFEEASGGWHAEATP